MAHRRPKNAPRPSSIAKAGSFAVIEVGGAKTRYCVHRSLLEEQSEYFEKALNGPWTESQEGLVRLEDVDSGIFAIFVDWLYARHLPPNSKKWGAGNDDQPRGSKAQMAMLKAYVLANRIMASAFCKTMQEALVHKFVNEPAEPYFESINFAFANLPTDDIILTLLVDSHCCTYNSDLDEDVELEERGRLPQDFLIRVMVCYSQRRDRDDWPLDAFDYYQHHSEAEQQLCMEKQEL